MSETLYNISSELETIHDELIDMNGEITPQLEERLDRLNMQLSSKVHNISRWVRNLESNDEAVTEEIERLRRRRDISTKLRNRLKEYVKFCMVKADKKKLEFPLFTATVYANPPSVEITDANKIPPRFVTIVTETKMDKIAILKALKYGESIEGARLITDKTHLRIS